MCQPEKSETAWYVWNDNNVSCSRVFLETGVKWLISQPSHHNISRHLLFFFFFHFFFVSPSSDILLFLENLCLSAFLFLPFILCHSFVLSQHSNSSLLILTEPLYVNFSASTSISSYRGWSPISVLCSCCCSLHLRIFESAFSPSSQTCPFFQHKKNRVHSSHFGKWREKRQLPNIDPSPTSVCLFHLYHHLSSSFSTLKTVFCLETQSPTTPRSWFFKIPGVIDARSKLLCQIAVNFALMKLVFLQWRHDGCDYGWRFFFLIFSENRETVAWKHAKKLHVPKQVFSDII